MKKIIVQNWGLLPYDEALKKQISVFNELLDNKINKKTNSVNYLIFCEHKHVFTLGRNGDKNNLLINNNELAQDNIDFFETTRGGDITYHGPGQIVCYPILDLDNFFNDIHKYMRLLEEVVIQTLGEYKILSERLDKFTGVWINKNNVFKKICAMGIKCSRWVTMHGFALNIDTNLEYFNKIIPCGLQGKGLTSMQNELQNNIDKEEIINLIVKNFANIFGAETNNYKKLQ
ncbi:MAG: lipoyl(octanoyl) transferase LipB [Solitalea-like symbiont of Acarus siro]